MNGEKDPVQLLIVHILDQYLFVDYNYEENRPVVSLPK
jgi:hypothetical protein